MYFVKIDLQQLYTRLCYSSDHSEVNLDKWLAEQGFRPTDDGWRGSADSMNCLSCSEILFSERLDSPAFSPTIFFSPAMQYSHIGQAGRSGAEMASSVGSR